MSDVSAGDGNDKKQVHPIASGDDSKSLFGAEQRSSTSDGGVLADAENDVAQVGGTADGENSDAILSEEEIVEESDGSDDVDNLEHGSEKVEEDDYRIQDDIKSMWESTINFSKSAWTKNWVRLVTVALVGFVLGGIVISFWFGNESDVRVTVNNEPQESAPAVSYAGSSQQTVDSGRDIKFEFDAQECSVVGFNFGG